MRRHYGTVRAFPRLFLRTRIPSIPEFSSIIPGNVARLTLIAEISVSLIANFELNPPCK